PGVRRDAGDRDVHDLPLADLVDQPDARAGAGQPGQRPSAALVSRARPARLRLLPPRRARPERRRLLVVPRTGRQDAPGLEGPAADDAVVPRVPPPPRAAPAAPAG